MRVVLDTNVLIDFAIDRQPFGKAAALVMELGYLGEFELWMGTSQISDLIYVLTEGGKESLAPFAREVLGKLCQFVHIYGTDQADIETIAVSTWTDLEDALVYQTAANVKADVILTRDKSGFARSPIRTSTCESFFTYLAEEHGLEYGAVDL